MTCKSSGTLGMLSEFSCSANMWTPPVNVGRHQLTVLAKRAIKGGEGNLGDSVICSRRAKFIKDIR